MCCTQCVRCANLDSEPLAAKRLERCSNGAGGNPQTAESFECFRLREAGEL